MIANVLFLLLFGGGAFLIAATLALLFAPRPWLVMTLVAGGPVLAATWFLIAYLSAPSEKPRGDSCADCSITFGRWWEFGFFVFILMINVFAWWIGAVVGTAIRWGAQRATSPRPAA
jgi:hypothetical protein